MPRLDGRKANELRDIQFDLHYIKYPEGSVLVSSGNTKVLCNVTVEPGVPPWMRAQKGTRGWVTAEYSMLPRATHHRTDREAAGSGARSQEIRRLIGRALRAAVNLDQLGQRTLTVDCDVLQADGGTRTAAITGGYVALALALRELVRRKECSPQVVRGEIAAVSAGIVKGKELLDLCYEEDSVADADANFVMDSRGSLVEVQATAERSAFTRQSFERLLRLSEKGISQLIKAQRAALSGRS